jgi:hypothetical protein
MAQHAPNYLQGNTAVYRLRGNGMPGPLAAIRLDPYFFCHFPPSPPDHLSLERSPLSRPMCFLGQEPQ